MSEDTQENSEKAIGSRTRSPGYPAINLRLAIERAKQVWNSEQKNPAPPEVLAVHWGLNAKSSTSQLAIAALKKFGLLEEVPGKARRLKLSADALNIILHEEDAPERLQLLKEAALKPKIHADLWAEYGGALPSDASLRHHLLVEKGFNNESVNGFIAQFRDTISFANLSQNDKVSAANPTNESEVEEVKSSAEKKEKPLFQAPDTSGHLSPHWESVFKALNSKAETVSREFTFPVQSGTVVLRVPFPMSESDYGTIIQTLEIFKPGIVKTEVVTVSTGEASWEEQADALAKSGVPFNLVGFSYAHHIEFYNEIAIKYDMQSSFDPAKAIAYFKPKKKSN